MNNDSGQKNCCRASGIALVLFLSERTIIIGYTDNYILKLIAIAIYIITS